MKKKVVRRKMEKVAAKVELPKFLKVRATSTGFFKDRIVRPGAVFRMKETEYYHYDRDGSKRKDPYGNEYKCGWVEVIEDSSPSPEPEPERDDVRDFDDDSDRVPSDEDVL